MKFVLPSYENDIALLQPFVEPEVFKKSWTESFATPAEKRACTNVLLCGKELLRKYDNHCLSNLVRQNEKHAKRFFC